jgi:hypothetical protein
MKKLGYAVAALGAIAIALPSIANAETTIIKKRGHDHMGPRAEFRVHRDYGMHRGWHHHGGKVVIIKRGHHHY